MSQSDRATKFRDLHVKGRPLLLYNAWNAGSAKALVRAGAPAVATSSWAVAASHGYEDGETLPLAVLSQIVERITGNVDLPVSVDFEGGYSTTDAGLAENIERLLSLGIVGINFEDRVLAGEGLHPIDHQARRIAAIRAAASKAGIPLFINARTDLFFGRGTQDSMTDAIDRAHAYAAAGASGYFVPGLTDEALIRRLCERVELPLNIMMMDKAPSPQRLAELGVARVSWGHLPYVDALASFERAAKAIYGFGAGSS